MNITLKLVTSSSLKVLLTVSFDIESPKTIGGLYRLPSAALLGLLEGLTLDDGRFRNTRTVALLQASSDTDEYQLSIDAGVMYDTLRGVGSDFRFQSIEDLERLWLGYGKKLS